MWNISEPAVSNVRVSGASILCIVLDAANVRQDEHSKIAHVRKYKREIDAVVHNNGMVLIIDNANDTTAVRMRDDELSQLESG